jgi:hypothetical protein
MMAGAAGALERPEGRTVWRRALLIAVPCLVAIVILAGALIKGVVAMSFAVGGNPITVNLGSGQLSGVDAYPEELSTGRGAQPVLLANIGSGIGHNVCIGVPVSVPILGKISVQIKTGYSGPISFTNFLVNANSLTAQGTGSASGIKIGISSSDLSGVQKPVSPTTGIQFGSVQASTLGVRTFLADAGSLKLNGLDLSVSTGSSACS